MTDTTFAVYGYSVVADPSVSTRSGGGTGGSATLKGGTQIFEDDDIIVFSATNTSDDGELRSNSGISKVVVYDNAHDYYHGIAKYTYTPMNPGQTANIQSDLSGMGDTYLRFNANVLVSSDPSAPDFNQLFVAPTKDLGAALENGGTVTFTNHTDVDYNGNGQIEPGTLEKGNGKFNGGAGSGVPDPTTIVICLTRGTRIDTPDGPRAIEDLTEGDLVTTLDHGPQPIRWIGSRRVAGTGSNCPVRIRKGVLGNLRDLRVSPNHRMLISGPRAELLFGVREVFVAAKFLVDDSHVLNDPSPEVDYFHMLFDDHQVVFAEGAPTESLYPGKVALDALSADSRAEILALFPELDDPASPALMSRYEVTRFEACVLRRAV